MKHPQTRKCEDCGEFFSVPMVNTGGMVGVLVDGPWKCEPCRLPRPMELRNPVNRSGGHNLSAQQRGGKSYRMGTR